MHSASATILPARLKVAPPGDPYERESDHVAAQVTSMSQPRTRKEPESRPRHDFSQVRIHTGAQAEESARAVNARAYTVGRDVVFGAGEYRPETFEGRRLVAHELVHVVQQESGASRLGTVLRRAGPHPDDPIHTPLIEEFRREQGLPPGGVDPQTGLPVGPTSEEIKYQILPQWLAARPPARFIRPSPQPQDPLVRLANGDSPGLTTVTVNGNRVSTLQDIITGIVPSQVTPVAGAAGGTQCQVPRNFEFSISAEVIVARDAGPRGWVGTISPSVLGAASPPQCAGRALVPATMVAQPSNADFVARVRASEQEHVDEIRALHDRHLVPYGQFLMGLSGNGANLNSCAQDLATTLRPRATQAAFGFLFGYEAATSKLDDPGGTHADQVQTQADAGCNSITLTLTPAPRIPGSAPGNVVTIAPTVTGFNPANLRVNGTAIQDGNTRIKSFSTPQNAQKALQVIQHYGMTSRNVIGPMEYFLAGNAAPSGPLVGADELPINPDYYQVSRSIPSMPSDWIIAEVVGNNVNVLVNFLANRDAAYSAYEVMRRFRFTRLCWVGGTRQSPEMLYFRT